MQPQSPTPATTAAEPTSWKDAGMRTGTVAAVFTAAVALLLVVNHFQGKAADPINSVRLTELKASLVRDPANEQIKTQIRALDLDLRKKHARHLAFAEFGTRLLIGGAVVFLISVKPAMPRRKLRPEKTSAAAHARELVQTKTAVLVLALGIGAGGFLLSQNQTSYLESKQATPKTPSPALVAAVAKPVTPFPSPEELKQNWPRFRGPGGIGVAVYTNAPLTWNAKTGENIVWKIQVSESPSSPVIWGDKLFLTAASATKREVLCYDAQSGKLLWQKAVDPARTNNEPPTVMEDSGGYGPSTPCTDGRRVYAIYANGDIAAFDFAGTPVWSRNLGLPENSYGHATSLEFYQDKLLVQFDQGEAKQGKSKILALDCATGKTVWESEPRPVPASWATPIVVQAGERNLLITCASSWVIAYDPANGKEVWRLKALYGEVLPSPVFGAGLVFTAMDGDKVWAIKPDGTGDVSATHVAWSATEGMPDVVSPVCDGQRLYLISSSGTVTCYDALNGKKLWEKETDLTFQASPTVVGNRLYLTTEKGLTLVLESGAEYKELARSDLEEKVLASPAFMDGRMYLRTKDHLYSIGEKAK